MDESRENVSMALARNVERVSRDGPGLRYSMEVVVLARDRSAGKVLLGGLGGMGVGTMWFDDDGHRSRLVGYEDAPEQTCPLSGGVDLSGDSDD